MQKSRKRTATGNGLRVVSESVKLFSAIAYFFGKDLYKKLNVPVGLISASKGGSPIEAWMSNKDLDKILLYPRN